MKIDSLHIKKMLEQKHTKDFFMCEVRNGPSQSVDWFLKFDAFAMKKSWSKPLISIYEIKTNRQDFLSDQKYIKYLEYCHEFYFACPTDLIKIEEIPDRAGLVYVKDKTIRTIKKAKYVEQKIPSELFIYIILSRLESDRYPFHEDKLQFYKEFLISKQRSADIGKKLSSKYRDLVQEYEMIQRRLSSLNAIEQLFKKYKIPSFWVEHNLEKLLQGQFIGQKGEILSKAETAIKHINSIIQEINGDNNNAH